MGNFAPRSFALFEPTGQTANMSSRPDSPHHIVISADTHCGADLLGYRPYLEEKYAKVYQLV